MVVVVPPPARETEHRIFVFADTESWEASQQWQELAAQLAGPPVYVDVRGESTSMSAESAGVSEAVRHADIVVIGGRKADLARWRQAKLDAALFHCLDKGGIVAIIGEAACVIGEYCSDDDGTIAEGMCLVKEAVISVCMEKKQWEDAQKIVIKAHAAGHECVKGYRIWSSGGALFCCSGSVTRVEPIGKNVLQAHSVPKSEAIGRALKTATLKPPDMEVHRKLGHVNDTEGRWHSALELAAEWLVDAQGTVVVSTGAGVSAESGIPTYRDEGGLWELYDQMEVSHIKGFARDPLKCWRFELELHQMLKHCRPNAAHVALAGLEEVGVVKTVITQNVDGLHIAAGSKDVIELHGSETRGICMKKGCRRKVSYVEVFKQLGWIRQDGSTAADAPPLPAKRSRVKGGIYAELADSSSSSSSDSESSGSSGSGSSIGPRGFATAVNKVRAKTSDPEAVARIACGPLCPLCGEGVIKPDAIYFGESLPKKDTKRAFTLTKSAKAFLIVGTSGTVAPACLLPKMAKDSCGAKIIEISPRETDLSLESDLLLLGTAATVLPALLEAVQKRTSR